MFCGLWHLMFLMAIGEAESALQVVKFDKSIFLFYSTNCLGAFGVSKNRVDTLVLEQYVLAMELWVHVSRLPMPHLDRDQWKHSFMWIGCLEPVTISPGKEKNIRDQWKHCYA